MKVSDEWIADAIKAAAMSGDADQCSAYHELAARRELEAAEAEVVAAYEARPFNLDRRNAAFSRLNAVNKAMEEFK